MKAHTFSINDVDEYLSSHKKNSVDVDRKLSDLRYFNPKFDEKTRHNNRVLNNAQVHIDFEKDINRNANFCIQTPDGKIANIADDILQKKGQEYNITYHDVYAVLTDKYKLSVNQTEYILATSYQGSISGGHVGFGSLIASNIKSYEEMINRNGNMSLIKISDGGNITYTGGQKIIFDCDMASYAEHKNSTLRDNLHTEFNSNNYIAVTITLNLGKSTDTEFKPDIVISVVGKGDVGSKIIEQVQEIPTKIPQSLPKEIVKNYHNFVAASTPLSVKQEFNKEIKKTITNIINAKKFNTKLEENLAEIKTYRSTPNHISKILFEHVEKKIKENSTSKNVISYNNEKKLYKDLSKNLQKFIKADSKDLDIFAKKFVDDRLNENNIKIQNKTLRGKITSKIKKAWKTIINIQKPKIKISPNTQAKLIGDKLKDSFSKKIIKNLEHKRSTTYAVQR